MHPTTWPRLRSRIAAAAAAVAVLAVVGPPVAGDVASPVPFDAPADRFVVARPAALPSAPWHPGHRGIDVVAGVGGEALSPAAGTVTFAGWVVDRPVVVIAHGDGWVTSLEPVSAAVGVGAPVARGEVVGVVTADASHCAPATCLHWGLRHHGVYVDPLDYLSGFGQIRLLPAV